MKKKYMIAALFTVMTLMLTGCSVENIPSFQAMLFGEPEFVTLPYDPADYVTLGRYKDIEVEGSVDESDLQDALDSLIASGEEKDVKSDEKVVQKNQLINYDYSGKIGGKEFEGGTAQSQYLRVGTGKMIDGFEDALIGMKVGEEKDSKLKFPDDYRDTTVAGKNVVFTLKINYIYKEATDDLVKKLDSQYSSKTVKEFKESMKKELESQNAQNSLSTAMSKVSQDAKIKEVPDALIQNIKNIQAKSLESQAAQNNMDVSTMLQMYGMTEDSYYEAIAKERLLAEAVAEAEGYRVTKQMFQDKLKEITSQNNISEEEYRKNFKTATSEKASFEDYIVYMMKYDYFYDLVNSTMKTK